MKFFDRFNRLICPHCNAAINRGIYDLDICPNCGEEFVISEYGFLQKRFFPKMPIAVHDAFAAVLMIFVVYMLYAAFFHQ